MTFFAAVVFHVVTLSWIASTTPNVTYNIYRGHQKGVCATTPYVTGVTDVTFSDTVRSGAVWYYAVAAEDADGNVSTCTPELKCVIERVNPFCKFEVN
jgi:hypothetical protein